MQPNSKITVSFFCLLLSLSPATVLAIQDSITHSSASRMQTTDIAPLLLTGQVASVRSQAIMVPFASSDMWQYQIQWMLPEGTLAQPGQAVVIFDKSAIANRIEQLEAGLLRVAAQEQSQSIELNAELIQAEFELKQARLELAKGKLDAGITVKFIAEKEYADNQFNLHKAKSEVSKKRQALKEIKDKRPTLLAQLAIDKQRAQLDLSQALKGLEQLEVGAKVSGPIIYSRNPQSNKKFAVGNSVQAGRQVAAVPAMNELEIIAWINEVDVGRLTMNTPVNLRLDSQANVILEGSIRAISRKATKKASWGSSNWFRVEIDITNHQRVKIIPGMSVLVEPIGITS